MKIYKAILVGLVLNISLFAQETTGKINCNGVTWTFNKQVPFGKFVNGDYYVVGPVTVINIDPKPEKGRHGCQLNPPPNQNKSGYDDREEMSRYDAGMCAVLPVEMKPGDNLVSAISVDKVGDIKNWLKNTKSHSPIKSYSVLTCLPDIPPKDAFRPSYADGYSKEQKIYLAKDLKRELLPRLPYGKNTYKAEKGEVSTQNRNVLFSAK